MPRVLTETKHYQAASRLREYVNTLPAGEKLPVTKVLMEQLETSHGTVIQALKTLAGEGLICRQFGKQRFFVAEGIERFAAKICLVRPDAPSTAYDAILRGLYETGQLKNWKFTHHTYRKFEEFDFGRALEGCDGCILLPQAQSIDRDMIRALKRPSRPVAVLLQHLKHPGIANVCIDDFRVGALAAETLYAKRHRRILVLRDQPHESTTEERLRGFHTAAERLGLTTDAGLFLDMELHPTDNTLETCYRKFSAFMEKTGTPGFTAVFTLSLSGGAAVLRVLRERGIRVPAEVSVLSYGGEVGFAPYLNPPLSCIEIDIDEFGSHAAALLDDMLHSRDVKLQYKIKPRLALRETVAELP
ncbi:MAG: substrate-binding domain-containing protein [Lentisphaeria bacterium]|nr:substrate-binding domain-containing protein [Lentisphaeria bacterium]